MTALSWTGRNGKAAIAELLLANGADPNTQDDHGKTPLMLACFGGYIDVVNGLLVKGAKINARDNDGNTALIIAADSPLAEAQIVEDLLKYKADVSAKNKKGETAFLLAARRGKRQVADLLRD